MSVLRPSDPPNENGSLRFAECGAEWFGQTPIDEAHLKTGSTVTALDTR